MNNVDIFWLASGGLVTLLLAAAVGFWITQEARGCRLPPPDASPPAGPPQSE